MSLSHSPKIVTDSLAFYYDMYNTQKSFVGQPSRNYVAYTPNYVNYLTDAAFVSVTSEIQRMYSPTGISATGIWWSGFSTGTSDSATKITYSAFVRGVGTANLQIHQVNTAPNNASHMGITGPSVVLDKNNWQRTSIVDIYQASATASQNILVTLSAGSGNYVEIKNVQCEYNPFASSYIDPSVYASGIRSNTQSLLDLTKNATITSVVQYASDGTFRFNGPTTFDYVYATESYTHKPGNSFTYEAWIKHYSDNGYDKIIVGKPGGHTGLMVLGSNLLFRLKVAAGFKDLSLADSFNTWYHVVGVYKAGIGSEFYVNGSLVGANSFTDALTDYGNTLHIGGNVGWSALYSLNASIPIVKIYNKALSAVDVKQNFNATKGRFGL